MAYNKI